MTMPRYRALCEYWEEVPPADLMLAAQHRLGVFAPKPKPRPDNGNVVPIRTLDGKPAPPTLDEKPGTMRDLYEILKASGQRSITF